MSLPGEAGPPIDAFAHCEAILRTADKDRFLSALFAPAPERAALHALYAFNVEIARIRELARESLAGEIRLQWWSDALAGKAAGGVEGNPVAAALTATIARYALPTDLLDKLIAARRFDLYDDPMRTLADFIDYAGATSAGLIELAARILAPPGVPAVAEVAQHAGLAYGIVRLLQAFPVHASRGQLFLPLDVLHRHGVAESDIRLRQAADGMRAAMTELCGLARAHLAQARPLVGHLPSSVLPALLPVALVRPLVARIERKTHDPYAVVELPQWRRQWRLWRAAGRPERIFA